MCGNDDDPTMNLPGPFDSGPRLEAFAPHTARTCAHDLEESDDEIPQDLPARPAPPDPGADLAHPRPVGN